MTPKTPTLKRSWTVNNPRLMEGSRRSSGRHDALHVDAHSRDVSMSTNRSHSNDFEFFAPSPGSSVGASVSMLSSRNSEVDLEGDEINGVRTIVMHQGVEDMLKDLEIRNRYPAFYKFLQEEDPSWFEPAPIQGTVYRVKRKTPIEPRDAHKLRGGLAYEMLDLVYRFYRQKHVITTRKRENQELKDSNRQLRIASVQIYAKAEQEEEFISNSLLKKIQKLKEDKEFLMRKYQKDEEALTSELMANVAKIAEIHQDYSKTEKLVADKQAEIDRLQTHCRRAEKNYQEELFRLRAEKVDHEAALEQEQELLINTIGKRMTQSNEEKRKMQDSLERAYLGGFVDYSDGVEHALRSNAAEKFGCPSSPSPTPSRASAQSPFGTSSMAPPQLNEAGQLYIENQKLTGVVNSLTVKNDESEKRIGELESHIIKLQYTIDMMKQETTSFQKNVSTRLNNFSTKMINAGDARNTPSGSAQHSQPSKVTQAAVFPPAQRRSGSGGSSRNDMNTM